MPTIITPWSDGRMGWEANPEEDWVEEDLSRPSNPYGFPTCYVVYDPDGARVEMEWDIELSPQLCQRNETVVFHGGLNGVPVARIGPHGQPEAIVGSHLKPLGIHAICPRCTLRSGAGRAGKFYVPSFLNPLSGVQVRDGFDMVVHWDDLKRTPDGRPLPTITIQGLIVCPWLDSEVTGVPQPHSAGRCGWRGRVERGRLYDDIRPRGRVVATY